MTYLLDTNVLSELRRPAPSPHVVAWFREADPEGLYVSVLVIGEIRRGVERLRARDAERGRRLEAWLAELRESFADRVLPISEPVGEAWGRLGADRPVPVIDGLQVATALVHGLVFVTRDTKTAMRTGVPWLDPWAVADG